MDTEGQVDRFRSRLERRDQLRAEAEARRKAAMSPLQPITVLGLAPQEEAALQGAGIQTIQDVLDRLAQGGDEALTSIRGFDLKALATLKKRLRLAAFSSPATSPRGVVAEAS